MTAAELSTKQVQAEVLCEQTLKQIAAGRKFSTQALTILGVVEARREHRHSAISRIFR